MPPEAASPTGIGINDVTAVREWFNLITNFGISLVITVAVLGMVWFYGRNWFMENIKTQRKLRYDARIIRYQLSCFARALEKAIDPIAEKCGIKLTRDFYEDLRTVRTNGDMMPEGSENSEDEINRETKQVH